MKTKSIVFIHGMFMTSLCWEGWVKYFEAKGFKSIALNWPGRGEPVKALRKKHPDPELGNLTLSKIVEYYAEFIEKHHEKPHHHWAFHGRARYPDPSQSRIGRSRHCNRFSATGGSLHD